MKRATINDAPAVLNLNDKAMWVLGYNAALDASPVPSPDQGAELLDIIQTIELGLTRGYTPADLLDENSPVRDRMRSVTRGVSASCDQTTAPSSTDGKDA